MSDDVTSQAMQQAFARLPAALLQAAAHAASESGMTVGDWLYVTLSEAVAARQGAHSVVGVESELLVPIVEVEEPVSQSDGQATIQAELHEIRQLFHEFTAALQPVGDLPEQMRELQALARDVRQSADAAESAARSMRPLERTLIRLAEAEDGSEARNDGQARNGRSGRLFRR